MSQEELSSKSGYKSRSSINKIKIGKNNLTQTKIKEIADALNTAPEYIMGFYAEAAKIIVTCPNDRIDLVLGVLRQAGVKEERMKSLYRPVALLHITQSVLNGYA